MQRMASIIHRQQLQVLRYTLFELQQKLLIWILNLKHLSEIETKPHNTFALSFIGDFLYGSPGSLPRYLDEIGSEPLFNQQRHN